MTARKDVLVKVCWSKLSISRILLFGFEIQLKKEMIKANSADVVTYLLILSMNIGKYKLNNSLIPDNCANDTKRSTAKSMQVVNKFHFKPLGVEGSMVNNLDFSIFKSLISIAEFLKTLISLKIFSSDSRPVNLVMIPAAILGEISLKTIAGGEADSILFISFI